MTTATSTAKNLRISQKKMGFLVDQIKKMSPQQAIDILAFTNKASSQPLKKVIGSAIANAKNNLGLDQNSLKFKAILIERGPAFKRFRPVSRGRAHSILKRTTHLTVTLEGEQTKKVTPVTNESNVAKESKEKK